MIVFEQGQKIVFIGDSITDCDRRGKDAPLGNGYVSMVNNLLLSRYPELRLRLVNRGVSGDTTRDLAKRWQRDVINERPHWLSVKIGINDVWRSFGGNPREAVPIDEYRATLYRLLDAAKSSTQARLILMQPYMIEQDRADPMRYQMDLYGAVAQQAAADFNAFFVPVQAAFDAALQSSKPSQWSDDRIHPNGPGHAIIALAFLRAVGYEL